MNSTRVALLVALAVAGVSCNDLQVGSSNGRIVFNETIQASPAIWRQSQRITVNVTDQEIVSCVMVTDHREGKDGEAKIVEGGEGQQNVTVELKSPTVFRGFDFNVVVYAALGTVQHTVGNEGQNTLSNDGQNTLSNDGQNTLSNDGQNTLGKDIQHPAVLTKDTDLNTSAKPETHGSVDAVTPKVTETTGKVTEAPRVSRNTEQQEQQEKQQHQDPIVKFVTDKAEKGQFTTEAVTTEVAPKTTGTLKVNKPIDVAYPKVSSTTEHNKAETTTLNVQSTVPTKNFDDHVQSTEVPLFTTTTENTQENKYDSISKELGQKVVFGIKKY